MELSSLLDNFWLDDKKPIENNKLILDFLDCKDEKTLCD
jgi:hypothetical protein